nr:hypothetical protein [Tanacetum cinerariifolium]
MASLEKLSKELTKLNKQREVIKEHKGNDQNLQFACYDIKDSYRYSYLGNDARVNDSHNKRNFKNDKDNNALKVFEEMPIKKILIQEGTLAEYCDAFKSLLGIVSFVSDKGSNESHFIDLFIAGLKPQMGHMVKRHNPKHLWYAYWVALCEEVDNNLQKDESDQPLLSSLSVKESSGMGNGLVSEVLVGIVKESKDGVACKEIKLWVSEMDGSSKCWGVLDESGETNESIDTELMVMEVDEFDVVMNSNKVDWTSNFNKIVDTIKECSVEQKENGKENNNLVASDIVLDKSIEKRKMDEICDSLFLTLGLNRLGGDGVADDNYEEALVFDDDQYEEEIVKEESMPVYDTDIKDVIEEEEGFVEKGGFGGEEDSIEYVVVVATDLCSSINQTTLGVDFEEYINTKSHELMSFGKSIIISVSQCSFKFLIGKKYQESCLKDAPMDDKLGFKTIKVRGRVIIKKGNLMQGMRIWML